MLFNSYSFIFGFLPVAFFGYYGVNRWMGRDGALLWLSLASLFFYGIYNVNHLPLLLGSIVVNYALGMMIAATVGDGRRWLLGAGVAANLGALAWYKYALFGAGVVNGLLGTELTLEAVTLPLAISFYTFQQITYLVDRYRGEVIHNRFATYLLFVTFFPQLIAGPIVHHKEMMPQFARRRAHQFSWAALNVGLTIFFIGLFKKVVIADHLATSVAPVFDGAAGGEALSVIDVWGGVLSYTFQLYFDFSGYSDMAVGLARLFGIRLPINFFSPYKATSVIDFWRRWHMTLSRMLRDYLYIPLGGGRVGSARRFVNLMATMTLGGLWHGAGWTFLFWGALHGIYLVINHGWRVAVGDRFDTPVGRTMSVAITFCAVMIGWVFFRATSMDSAWYLLAVMFGVADHAGRYPVGGETTVAYLSTAAPWLWIGIAAFLSWGAPNTMQFMRRYSPCLVESPGWLRTTGFAWRPSPAYGVGVGVLALMALASLSNPSVFLYFRF